MKTSITITFTILFIAVGIFYFFFGVPLPKPQAPLVTSGDAKLLPFDSEQPVRWIQIQKPNQKETLTLERSGESWSLKYPVVYPADKMMADGLLTALKVSTKARRLLREKGWEEYGLARPDIKIGIEAENNPKRNYLLLGDQSPVSDMIFARWEGEPEYFLLDSRLKQAFDRSLYSLREKRLIRLPAAKVDRIRVQTFREVYELSQKDKKWFWTEPVSLIGRQITEQESYQLLLILRDLHVKEFLDKTPVDETVQGFSHSAPYIQVWEKEKTSVVRFGKELIANDAFYAKIEDENVLLLMSKDNVLQFFKVFDGVEPEPVKEPEPSEEKPAAAADLEPIDLAAVPSEPQPESQTSPTPTASPAA